MATHTDHDVALESHTRFVAGLSDGMRKAGIATNPAVTEKQRKLFGVARAIQKGKDVKGSGPAAHIAATVSAKKVREFAGSVKKGKK